MPQKTLQLPILVLFFLSGASALIYEVVWMRQLTLVFGVTTYAATAVLAAFMGGLAIGSYLFGRRADRQSKLLLTYATLELGIGLYALCAPHLFDWLRHPYTLLRQLDWPYPVTTAGRVFLAGLVLLPPTVLMGGTFPLLARFFVQVRRDVGRATGLLYFANTAGAVAGCFIAGFLLIEHFGLIGTTRIAALTNVGLATAAALLARISTRAGPAAPPAGAASLETPSPVSLAGARLAFVCIGVSGFAALAYEVLWTRALLRYLHNSTYAFTAMLVTFLAGIAIGSWLLTILPGRKRRPLLLFAVIELCVGVGFVASALLFANLPELSSSLLGGSSIRSFGKSVLVMFVHGSLILLPPAIFLGAAVPLATEICARQLSTIGTTIGGVYAVNTVGSVLGSIAITFLLIPALGMQGSLTLLVAINFAMAIALALAALPSPGRRILAGVALGVALSGALILMPRDLFRRTFTTGEEKLLFYREGATDTAAVVELNGHRRIIYDDGRATSATWAYPETFLLGHLPMLLHPGEPRTVLHLCFGIGTSLSAVAAHDSVERIDSVELSPHAIDAADLFWTNDGVIHHPKVHSIIDDGRNFVMTSRETYDVIALEPPFIFSSSVVNLYTREFYRDVEKRLAPDGVFLQWLPVGEAPLDEERMLLRAFLDVFPHGTAWQQLTADGNLLLIGTKSRLRIDYQLLKEKMRRGRVRQDLELAGVGGPDALLSMLVFDEEAFAEFVKDVEPVTDDRTVVDFTMPRYVGSGFGMGWTINAVRVIRVNADRGLYYYEQRRSPAGLLTNLGGEDRQEIAARIRRQERRLFTNRRPPLSRSEWRH